MSNMFVILWAFGTCIPWNRTQEPTNIFNEFIDLWRLYRMYHEGGLRSRQTFILTLSSYGGCTVLRTREDSGADKHFQGVYRFISAGTCIPWKRTQEPTNIFNSLSCSEAITIILQILIYLRYFYFIQDILLLHLV